jgi:electron transfer flavoprotein beta subunit
MIAANLGWPHVWLVMGVEVKDGAQSVEVTREMESGKNEIMRLKLPAVLQTQAGINHPRYASLKGIMQAKRKELLDLSLEDVKLAPEEVGASGAKTETRSVFVPQTGKAAEIMEGDAATVAASLVEKLRKEAKVI